MANIDRVVNVQIALRTAAITTESFSDLLLLGTFTPQGTERVVVITSADELMDTYQVPSGSPLYKAASVAFSQIPTVPQLYIGNKTATGLVTSQVSIATLNPFFMEVGSGVPGAEPNVLITVSGAGFSINSKIKFADQLEEKTTFVNENTLTISINRWQFSSPDAGIPVQVVDPNGQSNILLFAVIPLASTPPTTPPTPPTAPPDNSPFNIMVNIASENSDWYAFCDTDHVDVEALDYALWAESNQKLFVTTLSDPVTTSPPSTDSTSVAAKLKAGNYFRTAWWWHPDPLEFTDVAITARSFTKYPGGETWANQRLNAVMTTALNETIARNVSSKNGNTFEPFRNINITQYGKVAGGEWIDVIRFRDWLCEEIRIRVFQQMIDNRIPYTDAGIAIIRTRITQALDLGVTRGGIAPDEINSAGDIIPSYTVSMPLAADVSANNKANRLLQDCYFTARLAGAIHVVEIKGVLTYEL